METEEKIITPTKQNLYVFKGLVLSYEAQESGRTGWGGCVCVCVCVCVHSPADRVTPPLLTSLTHVH